MKKCWKAAAKTVYKDLKPCRPSGFTFSKYKKHPFVTIAGWDVDVQIVIFEDDLYKLKNVIDIAIDALKRKK